MIKRLLFLLLLIAPATFAQTSVTGRWGVGAFATRPAACGSGDTWTDTDDANSYKCFPNGTWNTITGGGGGSPAGVNGDVQLNISSTFGVVSGFNYHSTGNILFMPFSLAIQGPSPWVDILQYGASATAIHTTGTGSGTALTVGVSTFANGNGITIVGGGTAPTMSTPAAPTVAPGESENETVVDAQMTTGVSGGSSYSYCILAEDNFGGVTKCSPTTTNASGPTALGKTTVTLSSISLTGTTYSFTSSGNHNLVQFALAHITAGSNSNYLSGWFPIQTITDATHAGSTNVVVSSGTSTITAASGTLVYFIGNNVTWTAVTGAYRYWVCAQRPGDGNLHIIGTALPGTTQFVDFGFNLNQTVPWYMSDTNCTAGSAQNRLDVDKVSSGGGTTSLVLTNGLSNSVTGAATRLDNVIPFQSAYATATAQSAIFIPPGTFEFNSPLSVSGSNIGVIQDGNITLNAPFWPAFNMTWSGLAYRSNGSSFPFDPTAPPLINCNSNPCIDLNHFIDSAVTFSMVGLQGFDNGVLIANASGFTNRFLDVKFDTGTDNSDNMGIAFWGPAGMPITTECARCSFAGGPNQNIDQTWAPLVYVEGTAANGDSGMIIRSAIMSRRGIYAKYSAGSGGQFLVDGLYRQGGITPVLAISNNNGNSQPTAWLNQVHMDSEQQAGLAMWGINSNMYLAYHLGVVNNPQNDGGGNPSFVTGSGSQSAECIGERLGDQGPNGQFLQCTGLKFDGTQLLATNNLTMNGNSFTAGATSVTTLSASTSITNSAFFDVNEIAAPANPASGFERWYANSTTHNLSCLTSAGGNCSPGGSAPTLQTNSVNNSTQNLLNLINSTTNATGLVITDTNTSGGIVQAEISGTVNLASGGCAGSSATTCFNNISLMTSLGDLLYGGAGGAETRLQGPGVGTALPYVLEDIPSGGSATAPQWGILGVPVPATQTGAFTFSGAGSAGTLAQADQLTDILANPSAPQTYTIPATSALNFNNNPAWSVFNENATNTVTFSSSSTIIGDTVALPLWQSRITQQAGSSSYIIRSYPSMAAWGSTCTTKAIQWSTVTGILCNQLSLTTGVTGTLPIANGGTNGVTQQAALNNIAPSAIRAGDIMYYNGTNWTNLAGNNSGTQFLQENGSGVPSWNSGTTTTPLSSVTAATGSATIASANFPITWNWAQTTAAQYGFTFGETAAKTGAGGGSLLVQTQAGSTGVPITAINSLTGSQTLPALTVTPTWNTTGVVDAGILENVTNTASGAGSLLMDLQVGGTSEFKVDKAGNITGTSVNSAITGTTQSAGDNSTKLATTAYVDTNACVPGSFVAQTDGATVTWAIGSKFCANASLTFTVHSGSRTLNITGPVNGGSYVIWLKQDGTGGEGLTLGTGCTWKVINGGAGAVSLSTGANAIDVLAFTFDGTNCYANLGKNYN